MFDQSFSKNFQNQQKKLVDDYKNQLLGLRTNRANGGLVEDILIDYYGTKTPLKSLATIGIVQPNGITIQPYDPSCIDAIVKAIQVSSISVNPVKDNNLVRINLPPLTEERRKELTKVISQKQEEFKVLIRRYREEAIEVINQAFEDKELSEDDKFRKKEEVQKMVDEINKSIEQLTEEKSKEVMNL